MKKIIFCLISCFFIITVIQIHISATEVQQPGLELSETETEQQITEEPKKKVDTFTLGEIVVKKKRIANIENATTTTIVTSEDIEAHSDKDLSNTLRLVPGITIDTVNKHTRFKMRGFDMPYIALLLDGIPIIDVYEANIDISVFPVMNLSEIIINRGVSSALYGTLGTVGSINMVTKKPIGQYGKAEAEYGAKGDYTLNTALGNAIDNFYYWLTATVAKQAPYEVSKKLTKSKRQEWFDKFCPSDIGYAVNSANDQSRRFLNGEENWPHSDMFKTVLSTKMGYRVFDRLETGITSNYTRSENNRYWLTPNTESYSWNNATSQYQWGTDPTMTLNSSAFNWREIWTINASPYINYQNRNFNVRANAFYIYTHEYLDGYTDADETSVNSMWGGAHSNWNNSSIGFNLFPSYKLSVWNKVNSSVMLRYDKHEEKEKADGQFINVTGGEGQRANNFAGYDWFTTKLVDAEQLSVAIEDEIALNRLIDVPVEISAGVSYDAQNLENIKIRNKTGTGNSVSYEASLISQYKTKDDSAIWGTRDSFNPVIGLTYEPIKDFLLLRSAFARKSKLPTMAMYANISAESQDAGLKPEKSYNTNAGFELFFLGKTVSLRTDYFYSRFKDKLATLYNPLRPNFKYYANIKGEEHQGIELISSNKFRGLGKLFDIDLILSYTYLKVANLDTRADSTINKGKKIADIPQHLATIDLRINFVTKTALNIFGDYQANTIKYAMRSNPGGTTYSTSYFKEVKLHNPMIINTKLSQKIYDKYEAYVLCRNILDDYNADPFNPGPGRQFFFGLSAEL